MAEEEELLRWDCDREAELLLPVEVAERWLSAEAERAVAEPDCFELLRGGGVCTGIPVAGSATCA